MGNFKEAASLRRWLIGLDICGAFLAWVAALSVARHFTSPMRFREVLLVAAVLALLTVVLFALHRLYRARVCSLRSVEASRLARSVALCAVAAAWLSRTEHVGPTVTVIAVAATLSFLVILCLRAGYSSWLRSCRTRGQFCRGICVLGSNEEAEALVHLLEGQPELGYRVVAVLGDPEEWMLRDSNVPALEPGPDLASTARQTGASGVFVAAGAVDARELDRVVRELVAGGLHVHLSTGLARVGHQRVRSSPLSHQLLFYVEPPTLSPWQHALKRVIDVVVTAFGLLVVAPVLIGAAIAIKLDDGGPITFRQQRVGRNGRGFEVIKLRTMVPNASSQLAELEAMNERNGPLFKLSYDPRVTRVGRFLRSTSIDELPQLFNVLRGEMSLVGPRPALPEEVAKFDVELLDRVSVQPGVTGLWQVEARDSPSFDAYRRLDLFYVDNWSVMMDLTILVATLGVVFRRAVRTLRGGSEIVQLPVPEHSPDLTPTQVAAPALIKPLVATSATDAGAVGS
jgi:exopolysaccharide biosynthesis polyprenyl glycosylphosphotransferase